MQQPQRIAIIGNSGSGKSYLGAALHRLLLLPIYHLDKYCWQPGWQKLGNDTYKNIHDTLCNQEQWIIEGMNLKQLDYRLQRAKAQHGGSMFKVFKETAKGLEWQYDADGAGKIITTKHKGPTGMFVAFKEIVFHS